MATTLETMTKCPNSLDNGLMARLEREFTTEEQGLFLQSFSAYLNHGPTDFVIDLDDVWEWVGFCEKSTAKRLLKKEFVAEKDFLFAWPTGQANKGRGGHNKVSMLMNVRTFKRFCMLAKTGEKADTVREYYLKMEEVLMEYLKECNADGVRQLMEAQAASVLAVERITADSELLIAQQRHNTLVAAHRGEGGVYIATLIWNGVRYQKIGGTDDIWERGDCLPHEFDNKTMLLAWVFPSKLWRKIEKCVKKLETVVPYLVGVPKRNGKLSTETFCLTEEFSMDTLIAHIKRTAARVESEGPSATERAEGLAMLQARNTQDALQIRQRELAMAEASAAATVEATAARNSVLTAGIAQMATALCQDTRNTILGSALQALVGQLSIPTESTVSVQPVPVPTEPTLAPPLPAQPDVEDVIHHKPRVNGRGQGVQKYEIIRAAGTPDKFRLLETQFAGPTDAARDVNLNTDLHATAGGISDACKTSAEYCGHRWLKMAAADLHMPQELEPTAFVKREKSSMVAMLSVDQTHVVEVFASQKIAAEKREVSSGALSRAMNHGTKSSGQYWKLWTSVDVAMQNVYRMSHELPGNMPHAGSNAIELLHPCDGTTCKTFDSTQEAIDRMQVSRTSIANAITDGLPMKGYVWQWLN